MKRGLCLAAVLGIMFYAVSASAFTFGRDTQPVSITSGAVVSDTVFMDSMVVNASTGAETTKSLTGVKQIKLKARTGIDVRVATGTGSSTATTYTIVSAGETLTLTDLNGISMTLAVLGNAATDTGVLSISYTK